MSVQHLNDDPVKIPASCTAHYDDTHPVVVSPHESFTILSDPPSGVEKL